MLALYLMPTFCYCPCLPAQALSAVTEAAASSLYEMATSKYGSFVARRLLCVLAGRDVAPPPGKKAQAAAGPDEAAGTGEQQHIKQQGQQQQQQQQRGPRGGALAAKLGGSSGDGVEAGTASSADYPVLLDQLAGVVLGDDWGGEEMQRLVCDMFAGPFLQALLRACTHNQ